MPRPDMEPFRRILQDERRELEAALLALQDSGQPVELDQTTQGRLSRIDAMAQQSMAKAGASRLTSQLQRIEAALDRHVSGKYGLCCRCGIEIENGRLVADPAAPFCMECIEELAEARQDELRRGGGR